MTAKEILAELKPLGRDSYKKVLFNHGVKEPCFGVKIADMKPIQKLPHSYGCISTQLRLFSHANMNHALEKILAFGNRSLSNTTEPTERTRT